MAAQGRSNGRTWGPIGLHECPTRRSRWPCHQLWRQPAKAGIEEFDFVWQIDYQLRFREHVDYMATDADHIGRLMSNRPQNVGIERLGLFLNANEAEEFNRRQELGGRISQVREALGESDEEDFDEETTPEYGPNFGGVWQDQLGGGDIVVAVVDPSKVDADAVRKVAGNPDDVRIVQVRYSWAEINSMRDSFNESIKSRGIDAAVLINSTGTGREFEIVTPTPELIDASLLGRVPAELVTVTEEETARPSSAHPTLTRLPTNKPASKSR